MQLAVDISLSNILSLVSQMNLHEVEELKNKLIEQEIYFKKYKKSDITSVIKEFKNEGYSDGFLKDLEDGLKKSSIHK